jgi:outer membrane receptor protein involved in Fe transport
MLPISALVYGQESTGNIYGRVVDEQGSSIPGATVTLTGETAPRSTTSDANGYFRFLYVAPDRYRVTVTMPGFATLERENVIVTLGRNTDVEMPLRLSGVEETVRVISATPLIDSRKVQTGITFSNVELREIPTSRDIYSLMQQVPGVQLDQVNVAGAASGRVGGPDFTTKGSGGVTYLVDGATVTDNSYGTFNGGQARQNGGNATFFDFESFEEVDVATGGSLVDLQTPGVTINIVTKRGTNELKGSTRFFYASDDWQANNLSDEAIEQGFETNSTRFVREYGAEVGGPIIKDRLWIWGSGARQDISLNLTGNDAEGNPIRTTARIVPFTAKLSAQLAASNSMSLFYQRGDRFEGNTGKDSDRGADTLRNLTIESDFYKLEDDHVFSPDLIASVYLSHMRPTYEHVPVSGTAAQSVFYDDIWHGSWLTYTTKNHQYQGNATVSKFFNTGSVNHELKFGFNYRRQVNDSASAWPGDQIFGSEFSTYALAGVTRGVRAIYKVNYYTGTLSDTLTFGNLTVNGGLRYDVQRGQNLPSSAPANPTFPELLPAIEYHGEEEPSFEYEDLQPRLSATYALGKNKSTLLRASYARYADQLGFLPFQLNGLPITSGFYYYWTDTDRDHHVDPGEIDFDSGIVSFYNVDPTTAPITPNAVDPGLTTPKTDELTFGVDQQIFTDFAVSATYTYRKAKHLQYRLPIGAGPDTWTLRGIARGTVTADNGFTLTFEEPFYRLNLPQAPTGDLFRNRPGASQTYHGVELTAVKRLTNRWMLRASAGWNDWTQDIPDEAILDPNNRWALGGQNDDGGTVVGYSGKDTVWVNSRWQFNVTALYQLPWDINVSANFFGREGFPQTYYIRSQQFDIDGSRTQNLVDKIDSYRLDDVYEIDVRLEKTFKLGPVDISPAVEVFNVTNEDTVLQRANRVGNYNFNTNAFVRNTLFNDIVETQSPRIVRVGARVSF